MSFRVRGQGGRVVVVLCCLMLVAGTARAQEVLLHPAPSSDLALLTAVPDALLTAEPAPAQRSAAATDRGVLVPLYVGFAALQMLDAHSTVRALRAGGVEQNPLLRGIAEKPAALVALKAGVAGSTIALADKMRARSRVGAIVLMAALNSAYAVIVAHNYRSVP